MTRSKIILFLTCVAVALFIGSTSLMPPSVYGSVWWSLIWLVIAVGIIVAICKCRMWRRPFTLLMHLSFLLMIAGGGVTAWTGKRGTMHLRPENEVRQYISAEGTRHDLPLSIRLESFKPEYYPGMSFPRDFHSTVISGEGDTIEISMNHIGRMGSWRMYQTSFDNQGGSIISVSNDPLGIALTYSGYLLFALSGLVMLINGRLRKVPKLAAMVLMFLMTSGNVRAARAVPEEFADSLAERQVLFMGRSVPFASMAHDFTYKITGSSSVAGMSPTRFVASLILYSDDWREEPFIRVKSARLVKALKTEGKYVSPVSLYDAEGGYLPEKLYKDGTAGMDADILKLDEKVALLARLWQGSLFEPLPVDSHLRVSESRIRSELAYVKVEPLRWFYMPVLAVALAGLVTASVRRRFPIKPVAWILFAVGLAIFGWRWSLQGYVPLAGAGDIMFFTSVVLTGICALFARRSPMAAAGGLLMAGLFSLVAWLSLKEPALTPLMPVLHSPWLSIHVALVMTAYSLLAFTLPVSAIGLVRGRRSKEMIPLMLQLLRSGVYILGLGIFTGAMWANVSWGRYWAWDPKETWALVTMMLYAIPLHRSLGLETRPRLFHAYVAVIFLSIVMTYAGVNYLPSLHAYQ